MDKKTFRYVILVIIYISGYLTAVSSDVVLGKENHIAIVVSKKIRPYVNVTEGMTDVLEKKLITPVVFFLSEEDLQNTEKIASRLEKGGFDLFVAIGPEAAKLVWGLENTANPSPTKKMFTAVLDPDRLLNKGNSPCGISLRIPVDRQVREISATFVNLKTIGLLFDARNNSDFYRAADLASRQYKITLVPLQVDSRNQISRVLTDNWKNIDCVWMIPDRTVISEKIIQHIIKLGIYHKKGVIGYNSFFVRSGAVFSFDFDYKALGTQTAEKIETYLETNVCQEEAPEFQTLINRKMVEKTGLRVRE